MDTMIYTFHRNEIQLCTSLNRKFAVGAIVCHAQDAGQIVTA